MFGMGMGLPPQKSKNFRGSLIRLFGHLRPERALIALVILFAAISVFFAVIGGVFQVIESVDRRPSDARER